MEKRYIIKSVCTATPENDNFSGVVCTYYYGKEDRLIGSDDPYFGYPLYGVKLYGYTRLGDAKRNYTFRNSQNDKWWKREVSIETVEC